MQFPEVWSIRAPRPSTIDPTTGNPIPGVAPAPVQVRGSLEQRWPRTEQRESGTVLADERVLLLEPAAARKVPPISEQHKVIGPDGTVWSVVRVPQFRRRRRPSAPIRYVALVVRRSTDIKEK